jgi:hypothetical protein
LFSNPIKEEIKSGQLNYMSIPAEQKPSVVEEEHLHCYFSPRGSLCSPLQSNIIPAYNFFIVIVLTY